MLHDKHKISITVWVVSSEIGGWSRGSLVRKGTSGSTACGITKGKFCIGFCAWLIDWLIEFSLFSEWSRCRHSLDSCWCYSIRCHSCARSAYSLSTVWSQSTRYTDAAAYGTSPAGPVCLSLSFYWLIDRLIDQSAVIPIDWLIDWLIDWIRVEFWFLLKRFDYLSRDWRFML